MLLFKFALAVHKTMVHLKEKDIEFLKHLNAIGCQVGIQEAAAIDDASKEANGSVPLFASAYMNDDYSLKFCD